MFIIIKYILQSFLKIGFNIYRLFNYCLLINTSSINNINSIDYNLINMIETYEISSDDLQSPWKTFENNLQNTKEESSLINEYNKESKDKESKKRLLDCNELIIKQPNELIINNEDNNKKRKIDISNNDNNKEEEEDINKDYFITLLNQLENKIMSNEFYPYSKEENIIISEKMFINIPYIINYSTINNNNNLINKKIEPILTIFEINNKGNYNELLYISYFISNIPNYLKPKFKNITNLIKMNTKRKTRYYCNLYDIIIEVKIFKKKEIKLKELLPNLIFINEKNFIIDQYIKRIFQWKYINIDIINIENEIKLFFNELNIKQETIEKDYFNYNYKIYSIGFILNQNNLFNKLKEINKNNCPILFKIIRKLTNFKYKLMNCFKLSFSIINLKIVNKIIFDIRKEFISDGLHIICIHNYEINNQILILIYRKIFFNFDKLSESLIDSYNIFLRDNNEDIIPY